MRGILPIKNLYVCREFTVVLAVLVSWFDCGLSVTVTRTRAPPPASKETQSTLAALRTYAVGCFLDWVLLTFDVMVPGQLPNYMKTLVSG